jgi:hypothetical protein
MPKDRYHDDERRRRAEFSTRHAGENYKAWMKFLYNQWEGSNAADFGSRLMPPHIDIGRTAPRSLGHCHATTGYGASLQLLLNEGLVFGSNTEWVVNPDQFGHRSFVSDLLLCLTVQQYVLEVRGDDESGYRGHGPLFTERANLIGTRLDLNPVIVRRRGPEDEGRPVAAGWPFNVRPEGYYGDDVTEALLELAVASPGHRVARQAPPPALGGWELVLFLLGAGHTEALRRMAATQVDLLHALRRRRNPVLARFERGQEDEDGSPIKALPKVDPYWLLWNGGTVRSVAEGIQAFRDYTYMPILADALEEAGCTDGYILRHLRTRTKGHDSRCWVMRSLLSSDAAE